MRMNLFGLKIDGTVEAWGNNQDENCNFVGQSTPPPGLSNVLAIAAGADYALALVSTPAPALPALQSQLSANNLVLSWLASAQNFTFQTTTNLIDPNSWTSITDTPVVVNSQYVVTNHVSRCIRFCRLRSG